MASVELRNATKIFRGPRREEIVAVNDLSLGVADKELIVLVGPSGCGKTSTLRLIAGLEALSAGTISIGGVAMNGVRAEDRDVAMVFQNHALYPHMTVFENIAFGLKLRKVGRAEIEPRVKATVETLGLANHLERFPRELSGGERQRVALARAIVRKPKVFLFDEPLSNLDPTLRVQLRREISRLHRQLEATMIYVTHDQAEAMALGQRIAVLRSDALQQVADPLELYHEPANMFVAGFIGSPPMNLFRGRVVKAPDGFVFQEHNPAGAANGSRIEVPLPRERGERLAAFSDGAIVMGLRPENIRCGNDGPSGAPVKSAVDLVEHLGADTHVHLNSGAHRFIARIAVGACPAVGEVVPLGFDVGQAFFFHPVSEARI